MRELFCANNSGAIHPSGMIPKANELLAEQCTVSRPITDVMLLAFERRGRGSAFLKKVGVDCLRSFCFPIKSPAVWKWSFKEGTVMQKPFFAVMFAHVTLQL